MTSDQRQLDSASGIWLKRRFWKIAGALLAVLLIWLVVRAADWPDVVAEIRKSNIWLLVSSWLVLGGASWVLRALRWRLLLTSEKPLRFWPVFWANSAGNLGNVLLPARAGEFIRAAMVGAGFGLSQRFILATAACERVLDLLVFVTLAEAAVWYASGIAAPIIRPIHIAFLMAVAGVAALVLASRSERLVHSFVSHGLRRPNLADRIGRHLEPVLAGLRSIYSLNRLLGFLVFSACIWLLDASGAKLVAHALGLQLSLSLVFVLLAGLVFISLIPATPGQLGVYQWVVIHVLVAHIKYDQALAYGLVLQAGGYLTLTLLGVPGLLIYRKSRQQPETATLTAGAEMRNSTKWAGSPQ